MTLLYADEMDSLFESDKDVRKFAMSSILFTAKFMRFLNAVEKQIPHTGTRLVRDLRRDCRKYRILCMDRVLRSPRTGRIPVHAIINTYDRFDDLIISASIRERIRLWVLACALSIDTDGEEQPAAFNRMPGTAFEEREPELSPEAEDPEVPDSRQIIEELTDYGEDIMAWLDTYFCDEYDQYGDDGEFDDLIGIYTSINLIIDVFAAL